MTDLFIEDDDAKLKPTAVAKLRAEVSRAAGELEHRLQISASNAMEEARLLVRRTQHGIHSRLGLSALAALGVGLVLGLIVALLFGRGGDER